MDVLSEEGEENVTKHVEKEYEKTKDYLIKKNNLGINEFKLAEKYIENIKFPYVFLFKNREQKVFSEQKVCKYE